MNTIVKNTIDIPLQEILGQAGSARSGSNSPLTVTVEELFWSPDSEPLEITLNCISDAPLEIVNPLYYLKMEWIDKGQKVIPLEDKVPVLLLNLNRPLDPERDFDFVVKKVTYNKNQCDINEVVNQSTLNFAPKSKYQFTLAFPSIENQKETIGYLRIFGNLVPFTTDQDSKKSNPFRTNIVPIKHSPCE
ncbi:hypothetical protein DN752_00015 [Echinicola strongylocentroti]|uniref:Uncharacterized protein n=1 Tax=Echinicola strongylocentroti TaxID=1795355 RepID=A0A2Z4ICI0_9BACT|nr:hypothetical protein [Echinicola strongylocentroti]AWW28652.1 hypothetical protein DN752_00015 [Echinicola strongylocentroti]